MEVPGKKLQAGPNTEDTTYCQPCEQDDEIPPAEAYCTVCKEFFCSKCASLHRKQKMSRSHTLLDKSNMPTSISGKEVEIESTEPCGVHPSEFIKYFCPRHQTLNCGHCLVQNHRSCHVDIISDISKAFKEGQEYGDIIKTIASLFEEIDSGKIDVERNVDVVAGLVKNEIHKLRTFREEVNKYFEEREQALVKLMKKMKNIDEELLGSLNPKYTNLKSKLKEINVTLKAQENNMIQLFIETKKAKKLLEGLQNDLADIKMHNVIYHYEFRKDPATERLIASDTGLGTLEHIMTELHTIASVSAESDHSIPGLTIQGRDQRETIATAEPTVSQGTIGLTRLQFTSAVDITTTSSSDNKDFYLSSMLHLAESRLLLADFRNKVVNELDMETKSQVSQISVPGNPWGLCLLPGDRVAVTLASKGIQFLETRGQIVLGDRFLVDGDCRGIAYHDDWLIVSYYDGKVEVLNMNGHVIRGRGREGSGQTVFEMPLFLTVVCENSTAFIYVSDYRKNTITKLDMNLNIMKTFQDPALKSPECITALGAQLLICGSQSNNIMILDLSTGHMTQLMGEKEGIRNPRYVYYFLQQSKLLVTEPMNNAVKVYNLIE